LLLSPSAFGVGASSEKFVSATADTILNGRAVMIYSHGVSVGAMHILSTLPEQIVGHAPNPRRSHLDTFSCSSTEVHFASRDLEREFDFYYKFTQGGALYFGSLKRCKRCISLPSLHRHTFARLGFSSISWPSGNTFSRSSNFCLRHVPVTLVRCLQGLQRIL
jgi:hypothetical protein